MSVGEYESFGKKSQRGGGGQENEDSPGLDNNRDHFLDGVTFTRPIKVHEPKEIVLTE